MRKTLAPEVEAGRVAGERGGGPYGHFRLLCPVLHRTLNVIASDGRDWGEPEPRPTADELRRLPPDAREHLLRQWGNAETITLPPPVWEHVSVSAATVPTWAEMCWVKALFWGPEEAVVQYHPPESSYVNVHQRVLHLWRPVGVEFPMPPLPAV